MSLTKDDIRASVAAGTITEAQAASILAQAQSRNGYRDAMDGQEEPFELFKGFNEVFIVIGLGILFSGWMGIVGVTGLLGAGDGSVFSLVAMLFSMGFVAALARYFTLTRRMVAPSIALVIMFAICAWTFGGTLSGMFGQEVDLPLFSVPTAQNILVQATFTAGALILYFLVFRVPFTLLLTALNVYLAAFAMTISGGANLSNPVELFQLSANGPFALITLALGLIGLTIALRFDMSDPHRVSRRSQNAFWLHVIAAPAIVNTIALTLFSADAGLAYAVLFLFVLAMAAFAIIIDRRSFLISAFGYMIALSVTVLEDNGFWTMLLLGVVLVTLGAKWEAIRSALMRALPAFPGKTNLPPYNETSAT